MSLVRKTGSPLLASSISRELGTFAEAAENAAATLLSLPVSVCPAGEVSVSRYGDVDPPLPNSWMIWCAAVVPG